MIHDTFDFDYWKKIFPLDTLRTAVFGRPKSMQPDTEAVTSPRHLCVNEQLRSEAISRNSEFRQILTDVFVFNFGEPLHRAVTKVGGLPYRSSEKAWPVNLKNEPLTFVGQFCFVDSQDITGSLPGDILLIFADADKHGYDWGDESRLPLKFEWVSLNEMQLITSNQIPLTLWKIAPCFGSIFRTIDYPDLDEFGYPDITDHIPFSSPATKIGGTPAWGQNLEKMTGRFLGQLNSIAPTIGDIYPYINSPEPITFYDWHDNHPLLWGDVGTLYLFIDDNKEIHWEIQAS
jgi:hypothetical protein